MADYRPGGVKAVHYSTNDSSYSAITGDVTRAENLNAEPINQEHTSGDYQSGDTANPTFYFADHDDYATLRNFSVGSNRQRIYLAIEFFNGTILKTPEPAYPKAWMMPKGNRSEGDSEWALSFNQSSDEAWVTGSI